MRFFKVLFAITLVAILSQGCGGGGGDPYTCPSGQTCGSSSGTTSSSSGGTTSTPEEMGAIVDGVFQKGVLGTPSLAAGAQLAAGGSTQLSLAFEVTKTGAAATDAITVAFSSKCPSGTTTITPATATNNAGSITATYTSAGGCGLTQDTVTATVTNGGANLTNTTASATIPLAQAQANSIVFLSSAPSNIGLQGTGQQSSSIVTFQVVTAAGGPVANATVNFKLSTTLGGVALVGSNPATTGTDGKASITVQAGTRAESVVVTASTTTTEFGTVSANSNSLTVTTGIPDATRISLAVGGPVNAGSNNGGPLCQNVEAYGVDGVLVAATMRMKDRFSNPVPDNTPVNFFASGGGITGQCLTSTNSSEGGLCAVNWVSQNPRPGAHGNLTLADGATADSHGTPLQYPPGRVRVLAVAVGEKHFTDNYGLGYFTGPPVNSVADPITPLVMSGGNDTSPGDPYLDADESGTYSVGEQYFNIQNLPTRQTDSGNPYVGLLCGGPNPTTLPALCNGKANSTTYVGAQSIIVMSTGLAQIAWPLIAPPSGSNAAPTGQDVRGGSFVVYISDLNGNPMPAGTTVGLSGLPGSVTATPSSEGFGCDDTPYGTALDPMGTVNGQMHLDSLGKPMGKAFTFGITDPSATPTGTQGTVTVTVTTPAPNKSLTSASVPITY